MQINLNVPVRLLVRMLRALEKIANDYGTVHTTELRAAQAKAEARPDKGTFYYQSDAKLYESELKDKIGRAAATGDFADFEP